MEVNLTPISIRTELPLAGLAGKTARIDAAGELYQFLALIRPAHGTPPLQESAPHHITSFGAAFRTTRLMADTESVRCSCFTGRAGLPVEMARDRPRRCGQGALPTTVREARAAGDAAAHSLRPQ